MESSRRAQAKRLLDAGDALVPRAEHVIDAQHSAPRQARVTQRGKKAAARGGRGRGRNTSTRQKIAHKVFVGARHDSDGGNAVDPQVVKQAVRSERKDPEFTLDVGAYWNARLLDASSGGDFTPELDRIRAQIESTLVSTGRGGRNRSLLLVGPNGSGKSAAIYEALRSAEVALQASERDQRTKQPLKDEFTERVSIVCLYVSGLTHCKETDALREIARQLKLRSPRNDSLRSSDAERPDEKPDKRPGAKNLRQTVDVMEEIEKELQLHKRPTRDSARAAKAGSDVRESAGTKPEESAERQPALIVFLLDRFEQYVNQRPQTFLYRVFNLLQSESLRMCILGMTTHIDAVDALEKRVKSRFSQHPIHIPLEYTVEDAIYLLQRRLALPSSVENRHKHHANLSASLRDPSARTLIQAIVSDHRPLAHLLELVALAVVHPRLGCNATLQCGSSATQPMRTAPQQCETLRFPVPALQEIVEAAVASRSEQRTLLWLTSLELLLLVALHRLTAAHLASASTPLAQAGRKEPSLAFTFHAIYAEYRSASAYDGGAQSMLEGRKRSRMDGGTFSGNDLAGDLRMDAVLHDEEVAFKAFQTLLDSRIVRFADSNHGSALRSQKLRPVALNVEPHHIIAAVRTHSMMTAANISWALAQ